MKLDLLLLPGLLCDARLWKAQVESLSDIANVSVADLSKSDSMSALASSAVDRIGSDRFAVAGLSMGGYVAFEIARQFPDRLAGLALLDTTARPDTAESTANRRKAMQAARRDFTAVVDAMMPKLLHPAHLAAGAHTPLVQSMALDLGVEVFETQQEAIIGRADSRPTLARIDCPTLVLCGREDAITPVEAHEEMAEGIPGAHLEVIERCGHLSTIEQPGRVVEAMRKWVSKL